MDLLEDKFEEIKEEALDRLKEIIKIPTENPPGLNYQKIVDKLDEILRDLGYKTEIFNPSEEELKRLVRFGEGDRPNLVGYIGNGGTKIAFNGHYDVVPAGSGWNVSPYSAVVKDGKLYGRGSADMKSGIIAGIYGVELLKRAKSFPSNLQVIQTFVPDEETVGNVNAGAHYLVEKGVLKRGKVDYVIFTEPTGSDNICYGHRGAIWAIVKIYGKKSHGGLPQLGVDAVKVSMKIIQELYNSVPEIVSKYNIIPEVSKRPSVLVGTVRCGSWMNTVADYCELSIVRRLIPEENLDEVRSKIINVIEKVTMDFKAKYDYDEFYSVETITSDVKNEIYEVMRRKIREVRQREPGLVLSPGTFDMRFTVKEGIPSINYGPGRIEQAHATDEYVEIKDFFDSIKVLSLTLLELSKTIK
ncbi:M20 family metallopeptidase [Sulfolobus acidocaldarius]|uniref:Probable succinyl-diaminopimelate desuccinylase n=4 Tax=Sulfolobus acidocaldarius TaxID=2285 RepID=Q4J701_SULAC|nr:M20 family metallopeptidase [Sulfolobus acidocaldarius]AAY81424.1 acetylornithine deacetylase [Sulfolobus acidocaldarius DSM 639]AGE72024.1 succinyl-diaminopimelate desuccinylase [Sulfolobus acidocaldarius N8]AGE74341.1 succinyl-diaminopimelate desuccinylase [Sulfolobus acidocaldarius Ron12/I]ALU29786.1 succinyl-diaminopimelate desuccinylase [Sulfolobus acidocaldarius]ALU32524.1 succinyl-diaminopimelate desuccinylase [Sulfolobus acidocaldarius]